MITFPGLSRKNASGKYVDGLGNQLFQVAATLAHSFRMNTEAGFPAWPYRDYFYKKINNHVSDPISFAKTWTEDQRLPATLPITANHMELYGFFQSEKYFADQWNEIQVYLQPTSSLNNQVNELSRGIFDIINITAVHVRRQDYLRLPEIFNQLPRSYYEQSMLIVEHRMQIKPGHGKFIFFSDDIPWCRETFGAKHLYSTGKTDIQDLFTMAMCRHHIIANSSFSWWGAYLKRFYQDSDEMKSSITIAPKVWFNPCSGLIDSDICCESWIKIS